ncbi:bifunctional dethiobiotin synthetase/7,8-diamino-pelargonic acid aminotransferase, mitochondrial [Silene latifolia]|uniref:bifunctional dethiobiotin synthetase/7,8-diamino-pelargonic acid aminotransferase, mitochondrial n=1 Tax=Silene latifolia TaxID=37657 RepID=UPI003D7767CB
MYATVISLTKLSRHRHHYRHLSTLPLSHPIYTVWSSNTGLGKTLVSAGLAASPSATSSFHFRYIKPVQTGFPVDSDSRFVFSAVYDLHRRRCDGGGGVVLKDKVGKVSAAVTEAEALWECRRERKVGVGVGGGVVECRTLYAWKEAVSPHLAVEKEGMRIEDEELLKELKKCLWESNHGVNGEEKNEEEEVWGLIETAGGVASPGPSGTLQCDLYRPFRLPAILVGDGKLGGISGTVSAYETLKLRGYDVAAVILEDGGLANEISLSSYLQNGVPVLVLPPIPQDPSDNLMEWFEKSEDVFASLKQILLSTFSDRVQRLHVMREKAGDILWWPFTQHQLVPKEKITVIDSRCGENFAIHKVQDHNVNVIAEQFDACASWWTQGPDSALQTELARDMGYAAARYGHVMFPENVYEPALRCAELLLDGVGKGWAARTFFSDNGSTAVEVALKMAFRKFLHDHEKVVDFSDQKSEQSIEFRVLALQGSYHGDTLGAMEAQAPSSYTGFLQQPWYIGRGHFIDPPTVFMHHGKWNILLPNEVQSEGPKLKDLIFELREELFLESRDASEVSKIYSSYISKALSAYSGRDQNKWIAALIMEPVIHGAGGMHMVDPLFQRMLVKQCRSKKIPVIFDEVFTGFWRLGVESAAELLHCTPDIACYAKLMTGGIIPLAATVATEDVFKTFVDDSKLKALLHGHSYSAHAMGCSAAVTAIQSFKDPKKNPNILPEGELLRELWDAELVHKISLHPQIKRLVMLGTVFALELQAEGSNVGYASTYAMSLVQELREEGIYMRPLGNVLYLMCGPCTPPHLCSQLLQKLYQKIDEFHKSSSKAQANER